MTCSNQSKHVHAAHLWLIQPPGILRTLHFLCGWEALCPNITWAISLPLRSHVFHLSWPWNNILCNMLRCNWLRTLANSCHFDAWLSHWHPFEPFLHLIDRLFKYLKLVTFFKGWSTVTEQFDWDPVPCIRSSWDSTSGHLTAVQLSTCGRYLLILI